MEKSAIQQGFVQLSVFSNESAYPTKHRISEGDTVVAGCGASCGIQVSGPGIQQFHCMFELRNGQVVVQDCETGGTTLVNGKPIEHEITCKITDSISIGQYQIVMSPLTENSELGVVDVDLALTESTDEVGQSSLAEAPLEIGLIDDESAGDLNDLDEVSAVNQTSDATNDDTLEEQWTGSLELEDSSEMQTLMQDEMELLRSEIEYLHSELASKDQEIAEYVLGHPGEYEVKPSDTEKLVCRLEELLDELKVSDEKVKSLEDLLRLSEEANRAEQEERQQIESWLDEIEHRVSGREAELEAEVDQLKKRVVAAEKLQEKAERQLKQLLAGQKSNVNSPTDSAQQKVTQLERLLESARKDKSAAEAELSKLKQSDENRVNVASLEQKLVELELETSRERAELARQRAELEAKIERVESENRPSPKLDDSDYRFAAMRDHLREIHEEEKMIQIQKKQNSLGGRISRLLRGK